MNSKLLLITCLSLAVCHSAYAQSPVDVTQVNAQSQKQIEDQNAADAAKRASEKQQRIDARKAEKQMDLYYKAEQKKAEEAEKKAHPKDPFVVRAWRSIKNIASMIHTPSLTPSTIPERRPLSGIDFDKKDLISCVDDLLNARSGGYQGPGVALSLLTSAMDNNTWLTSADQIKTATENCKTALKDLKRYDSSEIKHYALFKELAKIPVKNAAENKAAHLIGMLMSDRPKICEAVRLQATVRYLLGAQAGVDSIRCLMYDGRVRHYIGPSLGLFSLGMATSVSLTRYTANGRIADTVNLGGVAALFKPGALSPALATLSDRSIDDVDASTAVEDPFLSQNQSINERTPALEVTVDVPIAPADQRRPNPNAKIGIGLLNFIDPDDNTPASESERGIYIGAEWGVNGGYGAEFRLLNGPRHWDMLIDRLN